MPPALRHAGLIFPAVDLVKNGAIHKMRILRLGPAAKDFINAENLKKQKEEGVSRKLVGFEMIERGIPRHDYQIADAAGNVVGIVTSGTQSPSMGIAIGMGYVPTALATPDSEIYIRIRNKDIKAKVVKMPFYKK